MHRFVAAAASFALVASCGSRSELFVPSPAVPVPTDASTRADVVSGDAVAPPDSSAIPDVFVQTGNAGQGFAPGGTPFGHGDHTCALSTDGAVRCWGLNSFGEIGDGTMTPAVRPRVVTRDTSLREIAAGTAHSCAVHRNGTLRCWGDAQFGQLGPLPGDPMRVLTPTNVPGITGVVHVALGDRQSCALDGTGHVTCWGGLTRQIPAQVQGLADAVVLAADGGSGSNDHACAIRRDRTVWCWGTNRNGELGDGTNNPSLVPIRLQGIDEVVGIALGAYHTCAWRSDGVPLCCGRNAYAELGGPDTRDHLRLVAFPGVRDVVAMDIGAAHACVLLRGGAVQCWGYNGFGQVGDGTFTDRGTPATVPLPRPAVRVATGFYHSCAQLDDGSLWCWGDNDSGGLGDGTMTQRNRPVAVAW